LASVLVSEPATETATATATATATETETETAAVRVWGSEMAKVTQAVVSGWADPKVTRRAGGPG